MSGKTGTVPSTREHQPLNAHIFFPLKLDDSRLVLVYSLLCPFFHLISKYSDFPQESFLVFIIGRTELHKYFRRHLRARSAKLQVGERFLPSLKEAKQSHELGWERFPREGENQHFPAKFR